MTPLERQIADAIKVDGPMPVERFMNLCLAHPEHGYYMSRDPLGRSGDFTTAPEISQIFGELIGIWCLSTWKVLDAPDPLHVIELGPGRGTLMADLLRAAKIMPGFAEATRIHMVENSPALKALQQKTLARCNFEIAWHDHIDAVPQGATLIVGNEFLDALPIRQLQLAQTGWHERQVGLDADGGLRIGLSAQALPQSAVPAWARDEETGAIVELSPARDAYCQAIARRLHAHPGAAVLIDYGHSRHGTGDTLQAVKEHEYVDVMHEPGHADLTSHVNFEAVKTILDGAGLKTFGPITQSRFLAGMGLAERLDMLSRRGDTRQKMNLRRSAQRLVAGNEMGQLFKVLIATHPGTAEPAPFAQMAEVMKT